MNHPNSAAICGFEQSNGVPELVLEPVEGETLAAAGSCCGGRKGPVCVSEERKLYAPDVKK